MIVNVKKPLVSIIIPSYNAEKYIEQCLTSCMNQTYQSWEAICINDASTDNTKKIIEKYSKIDARIKIINLKQNQGISKAIQHGYAKAKGGIVAYLDSDDWWDDKHLELCIDAMNETGADIVNTRYKSFYEDSKLIEENYSWNEDPDWSFRINKYELVPFFNLGPMKVFKKSLFKNVIFEDKLCYLQDSCTSFQLSVNSLKSIIIPYYTYNWRIRYDSTTNSNKPVNKIFNETNRVYNIMLRFLDCLTENKLPKKQNYVSIAQAWKLKHLLKAIDTNLYSEEFFPFLKEIKNIVDNDSINYYQEIFPKRYIFFKNNSLDVIEKKYLSKARKNKLLIPLKHFKYCILNIVFGGKNKRIARNLRISKNFYKKLK